MEKNVTYHPETIEINGKQALVFVPELVNELAIVDLNVLRRLAALLPTANLEQIKRSFKIQIDDCTSIEMFCEALRAELAFHESVNMITLYKPADVEQPVQTVKPWDRVKD